MDTETKRALLIVFHLNIPQYLLFRIYDTTKGICYIMKPSFYDKVDEFSNLERSPESCRPIFWCPVFGGLEVH